MISIVWTGQAIEDVEAIRTFIARDSVRYAALVVEQILDVVDRLARFPFSGRIVPEVHATSQGFLAQHVFASVRRCNRYRRVSIVWSHDDDGVDLRAYDHLLRIVCAPSGAVGPSEALSPFRIRPADRNQLR